MDRECSGVVGQLNNALVLRISLVGESTFAELRKSTRRMAFGAFAYQDIPFVKQVEELHSGWR
ncbi:linear gramicidin synthetase subunit D [Paenibacillus mucilaginosus 3016]|uniref:Linear gramicidin synthetase subunit D n=1 Tax=Paenibacillus mucilaginosus 3016 TaxID=1116391 RepID=H6NNR6_9BACL|nr:linear gramicidin synthetase subunit D [Paenibacillus mucilaginosus 3016]